MFEATYLHSYNITSQYAISRNFSVEAVKKEQRTTVQAEFNFYQEIRRGNLSPNQIEAIKRRIRKTTRSAGGNEDNIEEYLRQREHVQREYDSEKSSRERVFLDERATRGSKRRHRQITIKLPRRKIPCFDLTATISEQNLRIEELIKLWELNYFVLTGSMDPPANIQYRY